MVFDLDLNFFMSYGRGLAKYHSSPPGHLKGPEDIAFGDNEKTYVLDCDRWAIVVFKKYLYDSLIVSNSEFLFTSVSICTISLSPTGFNIKCVFTTIRAVRSTLWM